MFLAGPFYTFRLFKPWGDAGVCIIYSEDPLVSTEGDLQAGEDPTQGILPAHQIECYSPSGKGLGDEKLLPRRP